MKDNELRGAGITCQKLTEKNMSTLTGYQNE